MQVLTEEQTRALAAETRGPILLGLSISLTILSSIFVVLRVIARFWIIKDSGWEDYTMVMAMVRKRTRIVIERHSLIYYVFRPLT